MNEHPSFIDYIEREAAKFKAAHKRAHSNDSSIYQVLIRKHERERDSEWARTERLLDAYSS